jgi:eukaryotic-like serine/threonine-protein kinase
MPESKLIAPVPEATPAGSSLARDRIWQVPYDVLKEASKRLEVMSLLAAVLWFLATGADKIAIFAMSNGAMSNGKRVWGQEPMTDVIAGISIAASLGLFFYIRKGDRDPQFILDVGLVYMVLTGTALGLVMHWSRVPNDWHTTPMISWIGAVVLMSAAIVPNAPLKTLIASLIAVSMTPLGMLIARARGSWDFGSLSNVLIMHYPDYLLVGVAVVISRVVTRLGQQVGKAREMGSYRLLSLLGKGGMGEVWRARHHMLARDAAIKLIQPDMLSGRSGSNATTIRRRFEQEARTTASLRSPHTVELYDFGVTRDGVFYYVMELLDGIDLETLVRKFGPQPPARVARILRQVCRSLSDAHSRGMIHRDIKPTNIFICRMGNEYDFAKVLDFGLVKVLDESEAQLTMDGATTGTPAYMAPEMAMGNSPVDGRTDLYGLGCVAYWLLTGSLVFNEKGSTAMLLAHLQKTPVAPSKLVPGSIPQWVDHAVMMCLAKDPARRPASADMLAEMLEDNVGTASWTSADAENWWRNHMPSESAQHDVAELPTLADSDALPTL